MKTHYFLIIAVLAFLALPSLGAQTKPRLAILPITGGSGDDGETIAELFSFEPEIDRVFIRIPRTSSIDSIMKEQQFQRSTGLTDSDTIARLGRQFNADYVVAGHIHSLGTSKLIIITIIHVESLQQVAGDYKEYKTIEEVQGMIPVMAARIAQSARINRTNLPKLAVLPFAVPSSGVNQSDAEVLAQLLATDVANSGKYAVLPRTSQIQAVMKEHEIQRSGLTETNSIKTIGQALNAQYVLAGNVRRLGQANMFTGQILEVENGSILTGSYENYNTIADGLTAMPKLSGKLTGVTVPSSAVAVTTPVVTITPAPAANAVQNSRYISLADAGWKPFCDAENATVKNNSYTRLNITRERIDGQQREVLTVDVNVARGNGWKVCSVILGNATIVQQLQKGSGIRFKVLGDGKKWGVTIPTREVTDHCNYEIFFTPRNGRVVEIDIPYSKLRQPTQWGRKVSFNKNSITGLIIVKDSGGTAGTSTIKIFDFEIY